MSSRSRKDRLNTGGPAITRTGLISYARVPGLVDTIGISSRGIKKKYHLLGDGTGYLSGTVAADITVVSNGGTAEVTVPSANRINVGVGTLWSLVLSNGSRYEHPTMTSATTAVMYDVSGNGRHLTLTSYTLATAVVESLTTGSDWLNQVGWTKAQNSLYPSKNCSTWGKGSRIGTVTVADGVSTVTYTAGSGEGFVRPSALNAEIATYTGYARFRATNHRYVGLRYFCTNPYSGSNPYMVVDVVSEKIVFAIETSSNVVLYKDSEGFFNLIYSFAVLATGFKFFQIGLTTESASESTTFDGDEILEITDAGWIKGNWLNYFPTTTAAIDAIVPSTAGGYAAANLAVSINQNAWTTDSQTPNISCWGDSHTYGNRWDLGIYPRLLAFNTPGMTVFNGGYNGQTAQVIRENFETHPEKYGDINVFWIGNNNVQDSGDANAILAEVMSELATCISHVTGGKYVVLTLVPNSTRVIGTFGGDLTTSINNAIITAYPNNHIDIRTYLQGFGDGSENDIADIANGLVPRSLRIAADNVHHNHRGHSLIANKVWDFINTNLQSLALQKDYVGGLGRAKYSFTDGKWPSAPEIIAFTGVDNVVYDSDGVGVDFGDDTAAALAAMATLADDEYLFAGTKAVALYSVDMSARAAYIKRVVGDD